jgi:hypothetical protein
MSTEPGEEIRAEAVGGDDEDDPGWPFGFIAVLILAALYVGWRLIQLTVDFVAWVL